MDAMCPDVVRRATVREVQGYIRNGGCRSGVSKACGEVLGGGWCGGVVWGAFLWRTNAMITRGAAHLKYRNQLC